LVLQDFPMFEIENFLVTNQGVMDLRKEIDDTYFSRFFVPLVISILVIAGVFVIIAAQPGTAVEWSTKTSLFANNNMNGGMRRLFGGSR
jgi:hypothetical protein